MKRSPSSPPTSRCKEVSERVAGGERTLRLSTSRPSRGKRRMADQVAANGPDVVSSATASCLAPEPRARREPPFYRGATGRGPASWCDARLGDRAGGVGAARRPGKRRDRRARRYARALLALSWQDFTFTPAEIADLEANGVTLEETIAEIEKALGPRQLQERFDDPAFRRVLPNRPLGGGSPASCVSWRTRPRNEALTASSLIPCGEFRIDWQPNRSTGVNHAFASITSA